MAEGLTCPFCGFAADADEEYVMLQHIELDHSEGNTPPPPPDHAEIGVEPEPRWERDDTVAYRGNVGRRDRSEPPRSRHHPKAPSDGMLDGEGQERRRHTPRREEEENYERHKRTQHRSVRSSSSQPSVIQAWKDLFRYASPRSSSHGGGSSGGKHQQRTRHKAKMDRQPRPEAKHGSHGRGDSSAATSQDKTQLGKSELGRHHDEKHMPSWLVSLLGDSQGVCAHSIIPVLRRLLQQDPSTEYAYLVSPLTQHVSKLRREGSFCGYRNIQMLISYIIASGAPGAGLFGDTFPTIFEIQDLIEDAWDAGYNTQGRVETGGIRGTRKYIGTPEAQALFSSLSIPCPVQAFKDGDRGRARSSLMKAVEEYFERAIREDDVADRRGKVYMTDLPPIYLQHRGHSLTIVGLERQRDKGPTLLVFDPSFRDPGGVRDLVDDDETEKRVPRHRAASLLDAYRRGSRYFRKYGEFEVLYLTPTAPYANH